MALYCRQHRPGCFCVFASNRAALDLEISLTDESVIVKRGLIAQSSQEMQLDTIEEVNVEQSWLGRLFGYGAVQIRGIGSNSIDLKWIADPLNFRKAIEAALLSAARTPPQVAKLRA